MESLLPSSPPASSSSNISSISQRRGHRKGQGASSSSSSKSSTLNVIFILFVGIFVSISFLLFHQQSTTNNEPPLLFSTDRLLSNEGRFHKTKKDCIPSTQPNTCVHLGPSGYDTIPNRKHRIGVLSPPGSIGTSFHSFLLSTLRQTFGSSLDRQISFVSSTHVPPYGYGGNHGYTKIIRLSTDLFTGSMDALGSSSSSSSVTERDVTSTLRQIVRWHCRLSHVAAHTGLMTVDVVDLLLDVERVMRDVFHFVWVGIDGGLENKSEYELRLGDMKEFKKAVAEAQARRRSLFSLVPLERALAEELDVTNELTDWPCLSFWDVEGGLEEMTPASGIFAKMMIPDCDAEYTNCNIMKDQCELHRIVDGTWQGYTCG